MTSRDTRRSSGEGTIVQRRDGRWQASLQVESQRRTVYGKTRSECAAKLGELQRQAAVNGTIPNPARRTLDTLLDAWLELRATKWKPSTAETYAKVCDRYLRPALGHVRLSRLTPDRIERLYARYQSQGKARTALKLHQVLNQALALATRWGWLAANPCDRVDTPSYHSQRKPLWTAEQVCAFLDGTRDHWLNPLWSLLVFSGCRVGEALALTWRDVDLAAGLIVISKSVQRIDGEWVVTEPKTRASIRTVSLPHEALAGLERQAEKRLSQGGGHLVFASTENQPIHGTSVAHAMRRECDRLGLPRVTPHGLRHLHASLLLAQGLPIPAVSQRLGHANPAITMTVYAHFLGGDDAQARDAIGRAIGAGR